MRKHGGLTPPPLTLSAEGGSAMQLAAQRIALNLHEAGFNVQVIAAGGARTRRPCAAPTAAELESAAGRAGGDAARRGSCKPR